MWMGIILQQNIPFTQHAELFAFWLHDTVFLNVSRYVLEFIFIFTWKLKLFLPLDVIAINIKVLIILNNNNLTNLMKLKNNFDEILKICTWQN